MRFRTSPDDENLCLSGGLAGRPGLELTSKNECFGIRLERATKILDVLSMRMRSQTAIELLEEFPEDVMADPDSWTHKSSLKSDQTDIHETASLGVPRLLCCLLHRLALSH
jgi:hypothetical protein